METVKSGFLTADTWKLMCLKGKGSVINCFMFSLIEYARLTWFEKFFQLKKLSLFLLLALNTTWLILHQMAWRWLVTVDGMTLVARLLTSRVMGQKTKLMTLGYQLHDVVHCRSRARDAISRVASRATGLTCCMDRARSPEHAKFLIFKIGPILAEIRPILWSEVRLHLKEMSLKQSWII